MMKKSLRLLSLVLALILAFGAVTVAFAAGKPVDEDESEDKNNNSLTAATVFADDSYATARLSAADDVDYFCVDSTKKGLANFKLAFSGAGTEATYFKATVYNAADENAIIGTFTVRGNVTTGESDKFLISAPGKFYLKVERGNNYMNYEYNVSLVVDTNVKSESEDNNTPADPDLLDALKDNVYSPYCYGQTADNKDVDWFKFNVPFDGYFIYTFEALDAGKFTVEAYAQDKDSYDTQLISSISAEKADGAVSSAAISVATSSFFIRVTGTEAGTYRFNIYAKKDANSEKEYNNEAKSATALGLGKKLYGSISFENVLSGTEKISDVDFYQVTTTKENKSYKVTLTAGGKTNAEGASWKISVYSGETVKLGPETATTAKAAELDLNSLDAGTYFIKVESTGQSGKGNYIIETVKYTPDNNDNNNQGGSVWDKIKAMDWSAFWGQFGELINNLGGWQGALKVIGDVLRLSFGTIFQMLNR